MLFPNDPRSEPSLWTDLEQQLLKDSMCFLVSECRGDPSAVAMRLSPLMIRGLLARLRNSALCRISATSRGIVAPHFAASHDGRLSEVTEFLTYPSSGMPTVSEARIRRDIETAVTNLFCTEHQLHEVFVPLMISPWQTSELETRGRDGGLLFTRRLETPESGSSKVNDEA